ncbi:unnamed protein product [Brassicogethes aeneus]|uniref:Integrase catalytic domain-containing protein n=1 Tax=Brassicogethes aeneus TaxID=1431903 RepID=A0A9P0BBA7_BRAAE|nr:unnamed protein product [Brassicogethes aeneus]
MEQERVARVLKRIRSLIANAVRSYESSQKVNRRILEEANENLNRIALQISQETFNGLSESIKNILYIKDATGSQHYVAPRQNTIGKGRPRLQVTEEQLRLFCNEGYSASDIAKLLGCSKSFVYKKLYQCNMFMRGRYSQISDDQLETHISEIHRRHPNAGHILVQSYLKADGIVLQRHRVRGVLNRVDPIGTASRWSQSIKRRVYKVASPNALWHMDAHLKLSRWGFVIHGCIDGYSRLIIYLKCEISIQAEPVLKFFTNAVENYGLPSRVRSDHGYENILVAVLMNTIRGLQRGSHITGRSVHNQRVERLWVDVYKEVCDSVYTELYDMEKEGILNIDNSIHIFCVQFLYINEISQKLSSFEAAWNVHNIRTEHSKTPRQLWLSGLLSNYSSSSTAVNEIFENNISLRQRLVESLSAMGVDLTGNVMNMNSEDNEVRQSLFKVDLELTEEQKVFLNNIKNSQEITIKDKYLQCVHFLNS